LLAAKVETPPENRRFNCNGRKQEGIEPNAIAITKTCYNQRRHLEPIEGNPRILRIGIGRLGNPNVREHRQRQSDDGYLNCLKAELVSSVQQNDQASERDNKIG
jgi:hypothetical protein